MKDPVGENPYFMIRDKVKFIKSLEDEVEQNQTKGVSPQKHSTQRDPFVRLYRQTDKSEKYGLIRRLESQAQNLSLSCQHSRLPSLKKKQCVFKEPRETVDRFIENKRKIFMQRMMIDIKQEKTEHLQEMLQNEREALRAREMDLLKDQQLVRDFINHVKDTADEAQARTEQESQRKEKLNSRVAQLQNQIQITKSQQEKIIDQLSQLAIYKDFTDSLWTKFGNNFQTESNTNLFLTNDQDTTQEKEDFVIPFNSPAQIPECLNIIEEQNLQFMTIQTKDQEVVDRLATDHAALLAQLTALKEKNRQRKQQIQRLLEEQVQKNQVLRSQKVVNSRQIEMQDGQLLDMAVVIAKVSEVCREVTLIKESENLDHTLRPITYHPLMDKEVLGQLVVLEDLLNQRIKAKIRWAENSRVQQLFLRPTEARLVKQYKEKRKLDAQKLEEQAQVRRMQAQQKQQQSNKVQFGRKDMAKSHFEKAPLKSEEQQEESDHDDERFFRESFDLCRG